MAEYRLHEADIGTLSQAFEENHFTLLTRYVEDIVRRERERIAVSIEEEAFLRERAPQNDWEIGANFGLRKAASLARREDLNG